MREEECFVVAAVEDAVVGNDGEVDVVLDFV